jgi:type VI protein secretion system component VasK
VTIKSFFFCLFLYVCLVWVGSAYWNTGSDNIQHYGLLFTAIGLIAVLAFIIGARLFGWWRLSRAKAAARPAPPTKSVTPVHPDDEAMSALVAEANAALAKAPSLAGKRDGALLSAMPLYLLIGPEGSGKTSTLLNWSTEPRYSQGRELLPSPPLGSAIFGWPRTRSSPKSAAVCLPPTCPGGISYSRRCARKPRFPTGAAFGALLYPG